MRLGPVRPGRPLALARLNASTQGGGSSGGGGDLWPLTGMGAESDWAFTGSTVFWDAGSSSIQFDGANEGDKAELAGSAKASFDAAVSSSTAYLVTLTGGEGGIAGTIQVKMKGGAAVDFTFPAVSFPTASHPVTSGTGSGFEVIAGGDGSSGLNIDVQITA